MFKNGLTGQPAVWNVELEPDQEKIKDAELGGECPKLPRITVEDCSFDCNTGLIVGTIFGCIIIVVIFFLINLLEDWTNIGLPEINIPYQGVVTCYL